ncbi:dihydrofolate reductase family protein [Cohnella nanjingensis]|uniref:Dihydrofolate reductase family protein n=1 Tax=Cohnella nanjingensis TaxID=1387779 RepID=A0A7X0RN25_9BACL|nr:dihydrofolate reductase family protein [Cohnella nanjingensis]MBB6670416.1 dihydrofolate reductase family protein [Cohnella nanjingensis]
MKKITLYMQISLNGIVSHVDEWMTFSDEIVEEAYEYYKTLDTLVIGGRTYPSMAEYWMTAEQSSASALERSFAQRINAIRKIVVARSERELVWPNSELWVLKDEESLVRKVESLKETEGKNISVESGVNTWQLFLRNALFDEIWLYVHPVVAARGERLFADVNAPFSFRLLDHTVHRNGVVGLRYERI